MVPVIRNGHLGAGVNLVGQHLPSIKEVLGSIPNTEGEKREGVYLKDQFL